jgi:salicylate hydroxylase
MTPLRKEKANDFTNRNGRSGEEYHRREKGNNLDGRNSIRTQRTKLQSALLSAVQPSTFQLGKKLARMEYQGASGIALTFKDGSSATADLVVGADGIRSVRAATIQCHIESFAHGA